MSDSVKSAPRPDAAFSTTKFPLLDADGHPAGICGIATEVTDRKATEEQLRQSEQRYRTLAQNVQQFVWTCRPDGAVDYVNPQYVEFTGLALDRINSDWGSIVHPDDLDAVAARWQLALEDLTPFDLAFRYRRAADGQYVWFLTRTHPLKDAAGRVIQWIGTATDIDARKRLEDERAQLLEAERRARAEAEHANRMKDDFLSTLSHELRTPLNAIMGYAQLLRSSPLLQGGGAAAADFAEGLDVIERNARVQTQIIADLLDVSRIISGKVRLDVKRIDLAPVIDAAVKTVRHTAEAKGVRLLVRGAADSPAGPVEGDAARLQQVTWNLLANAIKFTPPRGTVEVSTQVRGSDVEISVADTGTGISSKFLPHVFERFRQADGAASLTTTGGLGLGLAIVKSLTQMHGGRVRAASDGEGRGATFTVTLPLADLNSREPAAPRAAGPHALQPSLKGLHVLVIDDEPDSRNLLKRLLEQASARVTTAGSVGEALDLLRAQRPDVLLSDIGMPERDGFELIRCVRCLSPEAGGQTPAAAITAFVRAEDRARAILAGYQLHLPKPIEPAELLVTVARLAGR